MLTASLIVAVAVVPMLCRVFLRSSRMPRWAGYVVGVFTGAIGAGLCWFVWRDHIESWTMLDPLLATALPSRASASWRAGG